MQATKYALALAIIAVAAALVWRFALRTSPVETAGTGAPIVQVIVPDLSADARSGETLFNQACASCHGTNAAGQDGVAPPLVHRLYEPNHHSDAAFHLAAQRGVQAHHWPFGNMPPVAGVGRDEMEKIVAYVRTLQRANGIY
jgi:mono/diheme cytochrome c family protein